MSRVDGNRVVVPENRDFHAQLDETRLWALSHMQS